MMARGRKKGDHTFEDTQMNPNTKKEHAKPANKQVNDKYLEAIKKNVTGGK